MALFKTLRGKCEVDDIVTIESSPFTQLRRVYNGSKLVFASLLAVPTYLVLSIVIDSGIFIRFIGILGLGGGLLGGGVILVLLKLLSRLSPTTTRNEIPLDQIEYIATVKHGIVRPSEIRIAYQEPTEDQLSYRVLWMPHRWMDEAGELEVAREVFADAGIEVRTG